MTDQIKAAHIIAEAINWVGWALIWAAFIVAVGMPSTRDVKVEVKNEGRD